MQMLPIHYAEIEVIYARTLARGMPSLAITAPCGGEGVSSLAWTLACRSAAAGVSTLLIEANTATPCLAAEFRLARRGWNPDTPVGQLPITTDPDTAVNLLAAPGNARDQWGFRNQQKLRALLDGLQQRYQAILIDTSPLLSRNRNNIPADTIAAATSATVLLALSGQTREMQILEARQQLENAGALLSGTVINDRHTPALSEELCRESHRLDRWMPEKMRSLRDWLRRTPLINQDI